MKQCYIFHRLFDDKYELTDKKPDDNYIQLNMHGKNFEMLVKIQDQKSLSELFFIHTP